MWCLQVRIPVSELTAVLLRLTDMQTSWADVQATFPAQEPAPEK